MQAPSRGPHNYLGCNLGLGARGASHARTAVIVSLADSLKAKRARNRVLGGYVAEAITMRLFGASSDGLLAECMNCGRVLRVPITSVTSSAQGYVVSAGVRCPCGRVSTIVADEPSSGVSTSSRSRLCCPKCQSQQISANKKGFGLGKAAVGGFLLGIPGLLGGLIGSNKVLVTCLRCGHHWKAGEV